MPHRTFGSRITAGLICSVALLAPVAVEAGPLVLRQLATSNGGPQGIAADATGNVYFAEINGSVVRKIDPSGAVTVVAGIPGSAGFSGDGGPAGSAQLNGPRGIAIDPFGNLLIADYYNRRVRRVTPGGVISTIAGNGASSTSGDGGLAVDAGFVNPTAVFGDAAGNVYIADNYGGVVRKINAQGIISTIAGTGAVGFDGDGGPATAAVLNLPHGVAATADGTVYISDSYNSKIRKVDPQGVISTIPGTKLGAMGPIALDQAGNLIVSQLFDNVVSRVFPSGGSEVIAGGGSGSLGVAPTAAALTGPWGAAVDGAGRVLISEWFGGRILRIEPSFSGLYYNHQNLSVVGKATASGTLTPTGIPAGHSLNDGMAFWDGYLYIAESSAGVVRRYGDESGVGGVIVATGLSNPTTIAFNSHGDLFISEFGSGRITKVSAGDGAQSIFAEGLPGAVGLAFDADDNLFAGAHYDSGRIARITPSGAVQTYGHLPEVAGLAFDAAGNLYGSAHFEYKLYKLTYCGGTSVLANFTSNPEGIVFDSTGDLLVGLNDGTIQRVTPSGAVSLFADTGDDVDGLASTEPLHRPTLGACHTCGNGVVEASESCDDGNAQGGDGCSATCALETGYVCGTPGQPCAHACATDVDCAAGTYCQSGICVQTPIIDATALSEPTYSLYRLATGSYEVAGVSTTTAQPSVLPAGGYLFMTAGGRFPFTVLPDGRFEVSQAVAAYVDIQDGGRRLVVHGYRFRFVTDALTESEWSLLGHNLVTWSTGPMPTATPRDLTLIPGGQYSINTAGGRVPFIVGDDGHITYDPSLDSVLSYDGAASPRTLTILGAQVRIDATALSETEFALLGLNAINWSTGKIQTTQAPPMQLLPGGGYQFRTAGGLLPFHVLANGDIVLPETSAAWASVDNTTHTITVTGFAFRFAFGALSEPLFMLLGLVDIAWAVPPQSTSTDHTLTLIPGGGYRLYDLGGTVNLTVTDAGALTYQDADPSVLSFASTGRTLTAHGIPVTIDARASTLSHVTVYGFAQSSNLEGGQPTNAPKCYILMPGRFMIYDGTRNTQFTLGPSGQLEYTPQHGVVVTVGAPGASCNRPPIARCQDATVFAEPDTCSAQASVDAGSSDPDFGDTVVVAQSPVGSYGLGQTSVLLTATDSHGATSSCMATVTVVDAQPPTLDVGSDLTTEATSTAGAVVAFAAPAAFDTCDGPVPVSCTPASGETFPLGTTQVNCSAADAEGNSGRTTFTVTVTDSTGPTLTLPSTLNLKTATGTCGAALEYTASAHDDIDGAVSVACSPASGTVLGLGTTAVQCSASDLHGNTTSGAFDVVVTDGEAPKLVLPAPITAEATSAAGAVVNFETSATDNCPGALVPQCTPASGSTFAIGTTEVTCAVTDGGGTLTSGTFTVTVKDSVAPTLLGCADITADATSASGAVVSYNVRAIDGADASVDVTCVPPSGTQFAIGTTAVECKASDDANNTATCAFKVVVRAAAQPGCMTGGGSVPLTPGDSHRGRCEERSHVTHGFNVRCDGRKASLQVNWAGNRFHLDRLRSVTCSDDPTLQASRPSASFDTVSGSGTGRYNGREGATVEFTFSDAGEPGRNDVAVLRIRDSAGRLVLDASGKLHHGNHQAHARCGGEGTCAGRDRESDDEHERHERHDD